MKENKYAHAIEILSAASEGKPLQWSDDGGKIWDDDPHFGSIEVDHLNDPFTVRIKPTSKMVPFGPEDIKPGMVFRAAGGADWYAFDGVSKFAIRINRSWINYEDLRKNWEYSTDGVTWNRCEKEAKG